jgi:hypothetical protein
MSRSGVVWVELRQEGHRTQVQLAGESNRLQTEFTAEFEQIAATLAERRCDQAG